MTKKDLEESLGRKNTKDLGDLFIKLFYKIEISHECGEEQRQLEIIKDIIYSRNDCEERIKIYRKIKNMLKDSIKRDNLSQISLYKRMQEYFHKYIL